MSKKKNRLRGLNASTEEKKVLFIDAKNIRTVDQFLLVMAKNLPLMGTILNVMKAARDNEVFDLSESILGDELRNSLAFTLQGIVELCHRLQERASLSEEEVVATFMKDELNEAKRIVEASKTEDPQSAGP